MRTGNVHLLSCDMTRSPNGRRERTSLNSLLSTSDMVAILLVFCQEPMEDIPHTFYQLLTMFEWSEILPFWRQWLPQRFHSFRSHFQSRKQELAKTSMLEQVCAPHWLCSIQCDTEYRKIDQKDSLSYSCDLNTCGGQQTPWVLTLEKHDWIKNKLVL